MVRRRVQVGNYLLEATLYENLKKRYDDKHDIANLLIKGELSKEDYIRFLENTTLRWVEKYITLGWLDVSAEDPTQAYTHINNGQKLNVPQLLRGLPAFPVVDDQIKTKLICRQKKIVINDLNLFLTGDI
jgi:hypothetical protein